VWRGEHSFVINTPDLIPGSCWERLQALQQSTSHDAAARGTPAATAGGRDRESVAATSTHSLI
jgi:hypothetical protein